MSQPDDTTVKRSPKRIILIVVATIVGVIALGYGAIFVYATVLNDSPDELDESDLTEALEATTTVVDDAAADATPSGTESPTDTTAAVTDPAGSSPADSGPVDSSPVDQAGAGVYDGDWVPTDASEFGYRVEEVLAGVNTTAVGRSNEISGLMTVAGTTVPVVDIEVQVASITSDESRRDGQFVGRIMSADEFPTATFTLTQPIELGAVPTDGANVTASATGNLTLRGVTNEVTFDVTAQANGEQIGVLGSIPVLFSDYGIDNPSFGGVKTEDNGLVEFVLVFARA